MCKFSDRYYYIVSIIGFLVSASAVVGFLYLKIYGACAWAAVSLIFCLTNVQLNYLMFTKKITSWHSVETLEPITCLSIFGGTISFGAMVWSIFYQIYYKDPEEVMTVVWTFMSLKWNIFLYFSVKRCLAAVQNPESPLLENGANN